MITPISQETCRSSEPPATRIVLSCSSVAVWLAWVPFILPVFQVPVTELDISQLLSASRE